MEMVVAKILCLLGMFALMLGGILIPVRVMRVDSDKANRYRRAVAFSNTFGGGVFLATCFNALLPTVREKVSEVLKLLQVSTDYPLAETLMLAGFFLTVFVEQAVLTFRKERPAFIDMETFNAGGGGSEEGSDSEYDTPFIAPPRPQAGHHAAGHQHGHFSAAELAGAGPLRLASLVLALSAHSVFEGLALGLQEAGPKLASLFVGVAVHETLAALALGVSVAKAGLPMPHTTKLAVTVALMIPLGMGVGMGIQTANQTLAGALVSLLLQGMAAGTFLFVTFFEILARELDDKHDRLLKVLCLVTGYAILAALTLIHW